MTECGPFRIRSPATFFIGGSSNSGKSQFLLKLIENSDWLFEKPVSKVIWAYGIDTEKNKELATDSRFLLVEGLPCMTTLREVCEMEEKGTCMLVLDDLATELAKVPDYLSNLYTRVSHHLGLSVVTVVQNFFSVPRTARVNCNYLCIMKTASDANFLQSLGQQLFDKQQNLTFRESYSDATRMPYGYLFLDLSPHTNDNCRILSDIFCRESPTYYVSKHRR